MKTFEITIWNTVNMVRDIDEKEPELEQHIFVVVAENKKKAYQIAQKQHYEKTRKGVWEHEFYQR